MVAAFCRDHGLFLISDEVYREFVYDGRTACERLMPGIRGAERGRGGQPLQALQRLRHPPGLPGHAQRDVYGACLRMAQGRLSPPGLAQLIAVGRKRARGPSTRERGREYQKRRDVLYEGLQEIPGVFLRKPEGAFYFVARLPVEDSEDFAPGCSPTSIWTAPP